jgi:CRP-like cAMP-binding protein
MPAQISNLFLSGLSRESRESLVSRSIAVELPLHTQLYDCGCDPSSAYFLTSGLASIVTPMSNGDIPEVGFIGREGIVGSLQLLGPASMSTRCMMQLAGSGLKIRFALLMEAFRASEEIRQRVLEFVQEQAVMVGQIAGCNRLHTAEQRLARWLLMAQDHTQWDILTFTQEYLAEMIGTRRTTATIVALDLQRRGLISYSRGKVRILDRQGMEAITCDCYPVIKRIHANLYRRVPPNGVTLPSLPMIPKTVARTSEAECSGTPA